MARQRKNRTDSITEQVKDHQLSLAETPLPPSHITLRECDMPYWTTIVQAKRADSWTDSDLQYAAILAGCLADIQRLRQEIDMDGDVVGGKLNPKHPLLENCIRRSISLARLLQVHPLATVGRSGDQPKRNTAARRTKQKPGDVSDGLIPGVVQ